ncbi:MAG: DUF1573 domain-containing protein [Lentisphaerae bacterium]|nr:DUF1573 domain-containing protein [Lentisphaerota bacterium]
MYILKSFVYFCVLAAAPISFQANADEPPAAPASGPRLECDTRVRDFGVVTNLDEVTHTFVLRNIGDAPLSITRVHAPCGCTTASLKEKTISPGSSVDLATRLSLAGKKGRQRKTVFIHSNDPAGSPYKLQLLCDIRREVSCEPSRLFIGDASAGPTPVATVKVRSDTGSSFTVTAATVSATNGLRTAIISAGAGIEHSVQLFLEPGHERIGSRVNDTLVIRTDHPRSPELKVPVTLYFKPRFTVSPRTIVMRPDTAGFSRYMLVHSPRNEAFSVLRIDTPSDKIRLEEQNLSATRHRIVIRDLAHDPALDGAEFVIHLRRTDGSVTQLRVPIEVR